MTPQLLDVVVLTHDLVSEGLRQGDLDTVVEVHDSGHFIVEFVAASGRTQALVTLGATDVRAVADNDVVAVRPVSAKAS